MRHRRIFNSSRTLAFFFFAGACICLDSCGCWMTSYLLLYQRYYHTIMLLRPCILMFQNTTVSIYRHVIKLFYHSVALLLYRCTMILLLCCHFAGGIHSTLLYDQWFSCYLSAFSFSPSHSLNVMDCTRQQSSCEILDLCEATTLL